MSLLWGIWKSYRHLDICSIARQINVSQNLTNLCAFLVFLGNSYFETKFVCDKAVKLCVFSTLLFSCPFSLLFSKYIRLCWSILCLKTMNYFIPTVFIYKKLIIFIITVLRDSAIQAENLVEFGYRSTFGSFRTFDIFWTIWWPELRVWVLTVQTIFKWIKRIVHDS